MKLRKLVYKLTDSYPSVTFSPSDTFYFSPKDNTVFYREDSDRQEAQWALLHETGHALSNHENYFTDVQLLLLEVEAWESAKQIAKNLQFEVDQPVEIDENYVQDNIDSYRNWLHKRSLCPNCDLSSIQLDDKSYSCVFCHKKWGVSDDRFCRPYRRGL